MKTNKSILHIASKALALITLLAATHGAMAQSQDKPGLDDFSDPNCNSLGVARMYMNDTVAGGQTMVENTVTNGILSVKGQLVPARGQLAWASAVLMLDAQGVPKDLSAFEGIRLRIRIKQGNLSISANSADVTNYDYHAALVTRQADGEFHEVKIPFASMKRAWSEQTPLNTKTIQSISLVAFGMEPGSFFFEVDEVSFY